MSEIQIGGHRPGDIGRVVELHGRYYAREWNLGAIFEARVAQEIGQLMAGFDADRDGFWSAWDGNAFVGAIAIQGRDAENGGARLRFFIVEPAERGRGAGDALLRRALAFCDDTGFERVYLWTFKGLDAARSLYERHGFRLILEHEDDQWGQHMLEQKFQRERPTSR